MNLGVKFERLNAFEICGSRFGRENCFGYCWVFYIGRAGEKEAERLTGLFSQGL